MRELKITGSITNRDSRSFQAYLKEISNIPMISADEEVLLAKRIKQGDRSAQQKLIRANLRFVVSCAKRYQNMGIPLADLVNEGNIGLIKAAERFDESKGFKFISFAVWWIREAMLTALNTQKRTISLPIHQTKIMANAKALRERLEQELGREVSFFELTHHSDLEEYFLTGYSAIDQGISSIDQAIHGEDNEGTLLDHLACPDSQAMDRLEEKEDNEFKVAGVLAQLDHREREIISRYFGLQGHREMNFLEISDTLQVSGERVRQLFVQIMQEMKSLMASNKWQATA